MGAFNFHNHPFKDEILKMFDDGKNPYNVEDFLKTKGTEFLLSRPTLYKHFNYYKQATKASTQTKEQSETQVFKDKIEAELWATIEQCNAALSTNKGISPKDWQYYDQQKQSAIEKLIKMKDMKGDAADASMILSKFFQKFTIDKALAEEKEDEVVDVSSEKNDNGQGEGGDLLPGESV